jgi:hypothetical protein
VSNLSKVRVAVGAGIVTVAIAVTWWEAVEATASPYPLRVAISVVFWLLAALILRRISRGG